MIRGNHSHFKYKMADKDDLVQQFVGVTGADVERARFYLDSSAWNLELAMSSFFESVDNDDSVEADDDASMPTDSSRNPPPAVPQGNSDSKIATFSSMTVDSGSSDEEGQAYYAGGSDRSGQQVLGPPKKKDTNKLVETLFKSARDHGAEEKKDEEGGPSKSKVSTFVGAGYRLGETTDDTTVIQGAPQPAHAQQIFLKLKMWKNGFSIDNGPMRDYNDEGNKQFLDSISRGEVPQELIHEAKGGQVNLDMEDHRTENFVMPKVKVKAFSGAGHMLGSPAPSVATPLQPDGSGPPSIQVDESKPSTSVQLRLADGKRLVLKLNHSHTVSDIRQHIVVSNPQYATSNFCLMTTFPNKELTDETQTLEAAKLLNAVIVQRLK